MNTISYESLSLEQLHHLVEHIEEYKIKRQKQFELMLCRKDIEELQQFIFEYPNEIQYLAKPFSLNQKFTIEDISFIQTALNYLKPSLYYHDFKDKLLYQMSYGSCGGLFYQATSQKNFEILVQHFSENFLTFFKNNLSFYPRYDNKPFTQFDLNSVLFLKKFYSDSDFQHILGHCLQSHFNVEVYDYFKKESNYQHLYTDYIKGKYLHHRYPDIRTINLADYQNDPFYKTLFLSSSSFIFQLYNSTFHIHGENLQEKISIFKFCLDNFPSPINLALKNNSNVSDILAMPLEHFIAFLPYIKQPEACVFAFGLHFSKYYHQSKIAEKFIPYFDFIKNKPGCFQQFKKFVKSYQSKHLAFDQLKQTLILEYELHLANPEPKNSPNKKM